MEGEDENMLKAAIDLRNNLECLILSVLKIELKSN